MMTTRDDDALEATPGSLEMTDGLRILRDRIEAVPKRAALSVPESLSASSEDFGVVARSLGAVHQRLDTLWPED